MLRRREDFVRLTAHGRTRGDRLVVLHFMPNSLGHDRFGIATSRRIGGAVARNRVRRRVREILRAELVDASNGWDMLVVARPAATDATFAELRGALQRLLQGVRATAVAP